MSAFGDLKYPAGFQHFDYIDPNAPKGGLFSQIGPSRQYNQNFLTFNSLNSYILKGDAAQGMELTFASLMARAQDEPDAMYGLAARAVRISADGLTYRFLMRPEARFHDGSKLTAQDVAFSLAILKEKGHPIIHQLLRDMTASRGARRRDRGGALRREARARRAAVRRLPADLLARVLCDPPVRRVDPRRAARLRSLQGRALRARPLHRIRPRQGLVGRGPARSRAATTTSTRCATSSTATATSRSRASPARAICFARNSPRASGRRATTSRPSATAASSARPCPTTRRPGRKAGSSTRAAPSSRNLRLREALIDAFDFEWTNKTIMYGSYQRTHSVFQNSDMMAKGKPGEDELKLLEPFRGKVPDEVFGEPFVPPVSDGSGQDRTLLRKAAALLQQAGFVMKDGKRVGPNGDRISLEFLIDEPTFQPHHMPFIKNLGDARHRGDAARRRPGAVPRAPRRFRFRHHDRAVQFLDHAGDALAPIFGPGGRHQGLEQPRRHRRSGDRCAGRHDHRGQDPPRAGHRLPRARPRHPRRTLLGSALVPGGAPDRLLGRVRPPAAKPRYGRAIPETWWYDAAKAAKIEKAG